MQIDFFFLQLHIILGLEYVFNWRIENCKYCTRKCITLWKYCWSKGTFEQCNSIQNVNFKVVFLFYCCVHLFSFNFFMVLIIDLKVKDGAIFDDVSSSVNTFASKVCVFFFPFEFSICFDIFSNMHSHLHCFDFHMCCFVRIIFFSFL